MKGYLKFCLVFEELEDFMERVHIAHLSLNVFAQGRVIAYQYMELFLWIMLCSSGWNLLKGRWQVLILAADHTNSVYICRYIAGFSWRFAKICFSDTILHGWFSFMIMSFWDWYRSRCLKFVQGRQHLLILRFDNTNSVISWRHTAGLSWMLLVWLIHLNFKQTHWPAHKEDILKTVSVQLGFCCFEGSIIGLSFGYGEEIIFDCGWSNA